MMNRTRSSSCLALGAICLAAACAAAPASAQQAPPPPLPAKPLAFPPFHEATLPNGLRIIVVEDREQPIVNVDLYVESGSAGDPAAQAGLAELVAEMLTKGTPNRSAEEISRAIEGVGGDLSASATSDYVRIAASALSDQIPLTFELLGDVALHPTFPAEELDIVRTRVLSGLRAELAQPGSLADRRFMREVYGERHPYSRAAVPATIEAIDRADLTGFHQRHFRADNALLVVSGDVDAARVEALARERFGAWEGGGAPEPTFVAPPARDAARIYFVHRPGSVQSNILIGHVAIRPENPDYYPLQVLNKIVGAGADSRLFTILREQKGWTYGAYSEMSRPEDIGFFRAGAEVRNEVTDSAIVEMLAQLRRLREEPVPASELEAAKSFLVGSFPLRIETPGQIARQVAVTRLLGLPASALTEYRDRVAAVTAADVQRVARQYVRPDRAAIVVVGDATQVLDAVDGIAPVTLYDVEGNAIDRASLEVRGASQTFDASGLQPGTRVYQVLVQGNAMGTATMTLAREGEVWLGSTALQLGPMTQSLEARFTDDLTPISSASTMAQGPMRLESRLEYADGKVTGTIQLPPQMGGNKTVDTPVPTGTILTGMDEYLLSVATLTPGETITVPSIDGQSGQPVNSTFAVTGVESVTVPAGTFQAYRIEFSAGSQSGVLWVRQEAPHILLKQEFAGQPVALVLQETK